MKTISSEILEFALKGYEAKKLQIEASISELQKKLQGGTQRKEKKLRRQISPEGRARIAAAQRKRWAESKKK